jgi:prepilin peptidase CpaA
VHTHPGKQAHNALNLVCSRLFPIWTVDCKSIHVPRGGRKGLSMHSIAWWPTVIVLAIVTFTDVRSCRIPNWVVLPFLVSGVAVSGWMRGWRGIEQSLLGIALGTVILGIFWWLGGMGMGDLKLCAAVGAWIGPAQLMFALVITGIAGGIMVLCWAMVGGFLSELFRGTGDLLFGLKKRGFRPHPELVLNNPLARKMPYAPAIAIGTIISFFSH